MLGCLAYLIKYVGYTLTNDFSSLAFSQYLSLLPAMGEIGTGLWLLVLGIKEEK